MPLEERLDRLAKCGVALVTGRTIRDVLAQADRGSLEGDPLLLMTVLGDGRPVFLLDLNQIA